MPKPPPPIPSAAALKSFERGLATLRAGELQGAGAAFDAAVRASPHFAPAHHMRGIVLQSTGRLADADMAIGRAIDLDRGQPDYFANRALVRTGLGRFAEAITDARAALALKPDHRGALINLAFAQIGAEQYADAADALRRLIAAAPESIPAYANLGIALNGLGAPEKARAAIEAGLARAPDDVDLLRGLGDTLLKLGDPRGALARYRRVLVIQPGNVPVWSSYLSMLNYFDDVTPTEKAAAARQFGARLEAAVPMLPAISPAPREDRKLRIGFVSGDLRDHSVSLFLLGILPALRALGDDLYAYSSLRGADATTERLQQHFAGWRDIADLNDADAAAQIRSDRIDILIDLSGHSKGHRLTLFAQRPAPLSATWLGYPATTGLRRIDYVIADRNALPPAIEPLFTERPLRLPDSFLCFTPHVFEPPEYALGGPVTFGSFNTALKLSDGCVAAWARILERVPEGRLLLKDWRMTSDSARTAIEDRFAAQGVNRERLTILGRTATRDDHIRLYGGMTMALDPFPYSGTTTTMEALTAGVPVLTLDAGGFATRVGASLMRTAGLGDWVATDVDDYVDRAVRLVAEAQRPELRQQIRNQVLASPLCNAPRFAAALHAALHAAWRGEVASFAETTN